MRPNQVCVILCIGKAKQTVLTVPKDFEDHPKEPARRRAERRWRNYDVEKRFKEEAERPTSKESKELEIAETIENEKPDRRGSVIRAQTKFAKDIREMMEGYSKRNLVHYVIAIRARRKRLLIEKLRRLEARQRIQEQSNA